MPTNFRHGACEMKKIALLVVSNHPILFALIAAAIKSVVPDVEVFELESAGERDEGEE